MTTIDYYSADGEQQAAMLRAAEQRARSDRRRRAEYPGFLYEARKTIRRAANRTTPTHRGAPRNA